MGESTRRRRTSDAEVRLAATIDRETRTRLLARLTGRFGDLDLAEDALQEALAQALVTWPKTGVPSCVDAWLTTTAKRKALDVVRRYKVFADKAAQLHLDSARDPQPADYADPAAVAVAGHADLTDDRLGMFFACAHPTLTPEDRIALTLRFVAG